MTTMKATCPFCALPVSTDEPVTVYVLGVWAHQRCYERKTGTKLGSMGSQRLRRAGWRLIVNAAARGH
jgi:hypothetical protein